MSTGAVSAYHLTNDVDELLAGVMGVLFLEMEDMELEDDQGEEKGNNPENQDFGTLAAPGKGYSGVSGSPSNCEIKVTDTSVPPEDVDMVQVENLREVALASRPVKTLGSSNVPSANAKRSRLSESQNPKSCGGPSQCLSLLVISGWGVINVGCRKTSVYRL